MQIIKTYKDVIIYSLIVFIVGGLTFSIPTYFLMRHKPTIDTYDEIISKNTRVESGKDIDDYDNDNPELNTIDGDKVAVIEAEFTIPETRVVYEVVEVEKNIYRWGWDKRGGGAGIMKDGEVEMIFNPFVIPVDVEIKRSDDMVVAGVSTTNKEVELSDMEFYVDSSELFPEKNISVGIAAGINDEGTACIHGRAGYKGYDVIYEYSGEHEVLVGKSWMF